MSGSVQPRAVTGASALGLSEYYREAPGIGSEALGAYYAEAPHSDRPGETGENFTVFRSSQITGRAAERMGLSPGMSLDVAGMDRLIKGQHIVTGEQLTKHRGSPVYERDPDNARKYLLDADGNKIRKLDADGKPMIDRSKSTQGLEVITAPPKSVDILTMLAGEERRAEIIAAHEAANFEMLLGYVEKEVRLGKRTIKTPTQVREEAGADGPRVTKGERKGQASKMQGSKYERVPIETAWFSTTQFTSRWTQEALERGSFVPDSLIHTHNFGGRSGFDPVTDKWCTVDEYALLERNAATAMSAIYGAALYRNLRAIGVELEEVHSFSEDPNGRFEWRVKGISAEAERYFSTNHARIPAVQKEWEAQNPGRVASRQLVNNLLHDTKLPKDAVAKAQDRRPDWQLWLDDARAHGITLATEELIETLSRPMAPRPVAPSRSARQSSGNALPATRG